MQDAMRDARALAKDPKVKRIRIGEGAERTSTGGEEDVEVQENAVPVVSARASGGETLESPAAPSWSGGGQPSHPSATSGGGGLRQPPTSAGVAALLGSFTVEQLQAMLALKTSGSA